MKLTKLNVLIGFLFVGFLVQGQMAEGELKRWHKVSLTFNGPNTSETENPNPFTDFRLDVTFTHQGSNARYTVPGYYAACGNAENNSCTSGNKWRVHFTPDRTGTWNWSVSFKKGSNVAMNGGGSGGGFMDGDTGNFSIAESDKSGKDFRNKDLGRLQYVGEHYLRHVGTNPGSPNGSWFIKAGADSPENAFNYVDFDATPSYNNNLNKIGNKTWQPHQRDYVAADASAYTWASGKGTEILGMFNYLAKEGANVVSFLTWNTSGDGGAVFPHILKVSEQEYGNTSRGSQWNKVHHDRFDVSKLAQWEKVMEYADKKGVYLHFKTMETENDNKMDGNKFGNERKLYYRELIARFSHHLALNWNLTEETTIPVDVAKATAKYIKDIDPYDHNIVIHTFPGKQNEGYNPLIGNKSVLTGASVQTAKSNVHRDVKRWVEKSRNEGKKWVVANDEQGNAGEGVRVSDKQVREEVLWGTLMAGGAGVEYYSGYTNDDGDINGNDHRKRGKKYKEGGYALAFFNNYLQANMINMVSSDGVTSDGNDYVFAQAGEIYAVYRPKGGSTGLNLPSGNNKYDVQWYNPRSGGNLTSKSTLGNNLVAPDNNDWVALITKKGNGGGNNTVAVTGVNVSDTNVTLSIGQTKDLDATVSPNNATNKSVTWSSSNGNVVTVNNSGVVRAVSAGIATITVTTVDGSKTATSAITVTGGGDGGGNCIPQEKNGVVAVEAEHFVSQSKDGKRKWYVLNGSGSTPTPDPDPSHHSGASDGEYLEILPDTRVTHGDPLNGDNFSNTPGKHAIVDYKIKFSSAGKYFVWVRAYSSGTEDNGVHVGINGTWPESGRRLQWCSGKNQWTWESKQRTDANHCGEAQKIYLDIPSAGVHTISFSMREDGFEMDKFVLSKTYTKPSGAGPAENLTDCGDVLDGGKVSTSNGLTSVTTITGDNVADVINFRTTSTASNSYIYVITDESGKILTTENSFHDFEGATPGICKVYGLSYTGSLQLTGKNITAADLSSDKFSVSNNSIVVTREKDTTGGGGGNGDTISLSPIHDAFIQGIRGTNSEIVRIEQNRRTGYLMFDVSSVQGTITKAELKFTVNSDAGSGEVKINEGTSNNWTETTLSVTNKPEIGTELGQVSSTFAIGNVKTIPLSISQISGDKISLILTATSGNDFAFASKENSSNTPPQLIITTEKVDGGVVSGGPFEFTVGDGVADNVSGVKVTGNKGQSQWIVTDDQGSILGLPGAPEDVDFDGAGEGTCFIYHMSYAGEVTDLEKGTNIQALTGTLDLSNRITVVRKTGSTNSEETVALSTIHDAYLQGNTRQNINIVRVEQNRRTGYLMFDLSSVKGEILEAQLEFTVDSDAGNGNLDVYKGTSDNWTENNLSNANKPAKGSLLGNINTNYTIGTKKIINLKAGLIKGNKVSLILEATSGNDFAFASKENRSVGVPQLIIKYKDTGRSTIEDTSGHLTGFPNPVNDILNLSGILDGEKISVEIYNVLGAKQRSVDVDAANNIIDFSNLPKGAYFLAIRSLERNEFLRVIKE
ncbi:DUF5060 domain-containing protein [Aquimarina sp. RZ0]|uniref:CBM96 family carbohydrate-binding protein n=1 Tax=Aquimarina sp. RZ0 TaxID=2607730 RepID=UPI0011F0B71D|nr:DUF5060 domain-containing protein [Aquimarina sp. RZ0]KAA1245648.1 DUF5060 domain-containing protein [Aquimarina sp. RZ0]